MCFVVQYFMKKNVSSASRNKSLAVAKCLFVCLSVGLHSSKTTRPNFTKFLRMVLLWRRCDTLSTSGFVDVGMFSYNEANGQGEARSYISKKFARWWNQLDVRKLQLLDPYNSRVNQNAAPRVKPAIYNFFLIGCYMYTSSNYLVIFRLL